MIALFPARKARHLLLYAAPLVLGSFFLAGCDTQGYDPNLRYGLRTDPVLLEVPTDETDVPDRPGEFPITSLQSFSELSFPGVQDKDAVDKARADEKNNPFYLMGLYYHTNKDKIFDPADPKQLPEKLKKQVNDRLYQMFGTPAAPRVVFDSDSFKLGTEDLTVATFLDELQLDHKVLARGSKLYRVHCLHCHGLAGDGRGPTGAWVNPHPRDYRLGTFKYLSSNQEQGGQQKPRRADLLRVIREGIDGSSMPAFNVLAEDEREALASYVIHLSLRGEVELRVLREVMRQVREKDKEGESIEEVAYKTLERVGGYWYQASLPQGEMVPEPFPFDPADEKAMKASVLRGYAFFTDAENGCFKCHKDFGRASTFRFDGWGTMAKPRDVTHDLYRGGRRPLDLYWRVSLGINGASTPATMPAFGKNPLIARKPGETTRGPDGKEREKPTVWDIVNFVQILPYPAMRAKYDVPNID